MKGLELSRAYYQEYGAPMLKERFPALIDFISVPVSTMPAVNSSMKKYSKAAFLFFI